MEPKQKEASPDSGDARGPELEEETRYDPPDAEPEINPDDPSTQGGQRAR